MASLGETLPLYSVIPFLGMLLSISLFPLINPNFWHSHFGKISFFWALLTVLFLISNYKTHALHTILHVIFVEYLPF